MGGGESTSTKVQTGILAENNLVYRTTHGGFHQHYGKDNVVRNNIFADARDHQVQRSRAEDHRSFTFERNIVYWRQGDLFSGQFSDNQFLFQSNLYWRVDREPIRFGNGSFEDWRAREQDTNSIIADPLFRDPGHDDFSLLAQSPAFGIGFQSFDLEQPGIRSAP